MMRKVSVHKAYFINVADYTFVFMIANKNSVKLTTMLYSVISLGTLQQLFLLVKEWLIRAMSMTWPFSFSDLFVNFIYLV